MPFALLALLLPATIFAGLAYAFRSSQSGALVVRVGAFIVTGTLTIIPIWLGLCFLMPWCGGPSGGVGLVLAGLIALIAAIATGSFAAQAAARAFARHPPQTVIAIVLVYIPIALYWYRFVSDW